MKQLEVYDPPMCCSTGVCGPKVDPVLPRFAGDLEWVKGQGVAVARYNLAQQPMAFAENATVREALEKEDVACLPLILADGVIVSRGAYPEREALTALLGARPASKPFIPKASKSCCCCVSSTGSTAQNSKCC
ncbi:MAG TPA: arsenite efflux transporter metallochaperone ArsD [Kiritimatiellia bacterium]|nr:arsenite efflux transporter metallochaperone ArsD [Kiritimatiellia bacterium]